MKLKFDFIEESEKYRVVYEPRLGPYLDQGHGNFSLILSELFCAVRKYYRDVKPIELEFSENFPSVQRELAEMEFEHYEEERR